MRKNWLISKTLIRPPRGTGQMMSQTGRTEETEQQSKTMRKTMRKGLVVSSAIVSSLFVSGTLYPLDLPAPRRIRPDGKVRVFLDDYFTDYHKDACDFEKDGVLERVAGFGGVRDAKVEDGCLHFTAGEHNSIIYFGRWSFPGGKKDAPDENIGFGWRRRYLLASVIVRLKQSAQMSAWEMGFRGTHGSIASVPGRERWTESPVTVKGTDWQVLRFPLTFDRGKPIRALCLRIGPGISGAATMGPGPAGKSDLELDLPDDPVAKEKKSGPKNHISIDYIKVANRRTPVYYRKAVQLDAPPVFATLRINIPTEHSIYVNGQLAQYYHGFANVGVNPVVDITRHLVVGKNVIAIGSPNVCHSYAGVTRSYFELISQGIVLSERGQYVSLNTGADWEGTFEFQRGWHEPGFDDSAWKPVKAAKKASLPGGPVSYAGPLQLQPKGDPIFKLKKGIDAAIVLPKGLKTSFRLVNSFTRQEDLKGELEVEAQSDFLDAHRLRWMPEGPGVWVLQLRVQDAEQKPVFGRAIELAVVGRVKQKLVKGESATEGMTLRKLVDFDCTKKPPLRKKAYDIKIDAGAAVQLDGFEGEDETEPGKDDPDLDELEDPERVKKPVKKIPEHSLYVLNAVGGRPGESRVVERPYGTYRESGSGGWDGFGYTFSVEKLYRPHLVEVEYPDDQRRMMMVKVFSSWNRGALGNPGAYDWDWSWEQRKYSGVETGGGALPVSNAYKKLYLIFMPDGNREVNTVQVMTEFPGMRAAARRITVYEIDEVPALEVPDTRDRLFGMFVEREHLMPSTFYSGRFGGGFKMYENSYKDTLTRLRDWYDTIENLVKYLKYSGQNLYIPGYYMYTGIYLPEERGQSKSYFRKPTDHFRLMASMFEENDLYLMLGAQYMTSPEPQAKAWPTNWEIAHEGKDTVHSVTVDGRQSLYSGSAGSGAMDYQHPYVHEDIMAMIRKFVEYGRDYRSVRGVYLYTASVGFPSVPMLYRLGGPSDSALGWALNDSIFEAFEKQTETKIPIERKDPKRFLKRYQYFLERPEVLEKWVAFRSGRIHTQLVEILGIMREARPDWKLYTIPGVPGPMENAQVQRGELTYAEAMRRRGYDYALYREDGIVANFGNFVGRARGRDVPLSQQFPVYPKDSLLYYNAGPTPAHSHTLFPAEPYSARPYTAAMSHHDASVITFGKADVVLISGAEHRMRAFVKAFRLLPPGDYTTLMGDAFDKRIAVREAVTPKGHFFYVVNPGKVPLEATQALDKGGSVTELATKQVTKGKTVSFKVLPYSLRSFQLDPPDARIVSAKVSGP